jgi:hypothetical protein
MLGAQSRKRGLACQGGPVLPGLRHDFMRAMYKNNIILLLRPEGKIPTVGDTLVRRLRIKTIEPIGFLAPNTPVFTRVSDVDMLPCLVNDTRERKRPLPPPGGLWSPCLP